MGGGTPGGEQGANRRIMRTATPSRSLQRSTLARAHTHRRGELFAPESSDQCQLSLLSVPPRCRGRQSSQSGETGDESIRSAGEPGSCTSSEDATGQTISSFSKRRHVLARPAALTRHCAPTSVASRGGWSTKAKAAPCPSTHKICGLVCAL